MKCASAVAKILRELHPVIIHLAATITRQDEAIYDGLVDIAPMAESG